MDNDKTKLEYALGLAKLGYHVFPIVPFTKLPPKDFAFKQEATRDISKITHWWTNGYTDYNIGIFTEKFLESEALIVIDEDNKNGKMGADSISKLSTVEGIKIPITAEQTTPNNGKHYILRAAQAISGGVDVLGENSGVDVRSKGQYIVGHGSELSTGKYKLNDSAPAKAPTDLVARLSKRTKKPIKVKDRPNLAINRSFAIERGREYLEVAPASIKHKGGDATALKVAMRLKDFGLSENDCFNLMINSSWYERSTPGWPEDKLRVKVQNAFTYGANDPGALAPENDFEIISIDDLLGIKPKETKAFDLKMFKSINPNLSQTFLVDDLLSLNAMSIVYGESNSGKTFFMLDLALHISLGKPWHNKEVEKGAVIYVASEGGFGVQKRISAFRKYHKLDEQEVPFALIDVSVDLKSDTAKILKAIKTLEETTNEKVRLVVLDTLARTIGDGNENEAKDMGAFIKAADAIRENSDAHIAVIHHTGKDTTRGARGHSSLRGATDTEILVEANSAKVKKQRDMEFGPDMPFSLHQVTVGFNAKGKEVTSCVVLHGVSAVIEDLKPILPLIPGTARGNAYDALVKAFGSKAFPAPNECELGDDERVVDYDDWREMFYDVNYPGQPKNRSWYTIFKRLAEGLEKDGFIKTKDRFVWFQD